VGGKRKAAIIVDGEEEAAIVEHDVRTLHPTFILTASLTLSAVLTTTLSLAFARTLKTGSSSNGRTPTTSRHTSATSIVGSSTASSTSPTPLLPPRDANRDRP
jgi:hypothetical protein